MHPSVASREENRSSANPSLPERHSEVVMRDATDPDFEQLLHVHDRSVRALARALVGAGPDADDVVQETWLLAMRRPPRHHRDLRAWLATIVRNVVRQDRRARDRRDRHQRSAPRPADIEAPAQLVERAELQRRIVEAVLAMREPLRATLLLRYFEGLGPRAIAQRHGVPLETVRTRLRRGMHQLRDELTRSTDGHSDGWLPIAAAIAAHPATTPTLCTALLLSMKGKLSVAALALLFAWIAIDAFTAPTDTPPVDAHTTARAAAQATVDRGERAPPPREATASRDRVAATGAHTLSGIVTGIRANLPFTADLRLGATRAGGADGTRSTTLRAALRGDGTFAIALPEWIVRPLAETESRTLELTADDPHYLPVRRAVTDADLLADTPLQVDVRCAAVLRGAVRLADDTPATAALLAAHVEGGDGPATDPIATTRTDADGNWQLRLAAAANVTLLAYVPDPDAADHDPAGDASPAWQPGTARARAVLATATEVPPITLRPGLEITGRVSWPDGTAIADARVSGHARGGVAYLQPDRTAFSLLADGRAVRASASMRTDAHGRYRLRGLSDRDVEVGLQWIGSDPVVVDGLSRTAVAPASVDIVVDAVQLRLLVSDGARPLADAEVRVRNGNLVFAAGAERGRRRVVLGRDRTFELVAEAPGHVTRELTWEAPAGAAVADLEIVLQPHPAHDVAIELDDAFRHAHFTLQPLADDTVDHRLDFEPPRTDDGFVLPDVPAGRYRLTVGRPHERRHDNWLVEHSRELDVPTRGPVRLADVVAGGRIVVSCKSHDGRFLAGKCEIRDAAGIEVQTPFQVIKTGSKWFGGKGRLLPAGPNESGHNLTAGDYLVRVTPEGEGSREQWVTVVAGRSSEVAFVY